MIKKLMLVVFSAIIFVGCSGPTPGPATDPDLAKFMAKTIEGAYNIDTPILAFNEDLHQKAVNPSRNTYRIQTNGQETYMHCALASRPAAQDETTTLTVAVAGISNLTPKAYNVKMVKQSGKKMWLWDETGKIGFIVEY